MPCFAPGSGTPGSVFVHRALWFCWDDVEVDEEEALVVEVFLRVVDVVWEVVLLVLAAVVVDDLLESVDVVELLDVVVDGWLLDAVVKVWVAVVVGEEAVVDDSEAVLAEGVEVSLLVT